jgi:hypothetical protein
MSNTQSTAARQEAGNSGDLTAGPQDHSPTAKLPQGPPPTFAAFFQPGNHLISRELMMHFDGLDFKHLKEAAQGVNTELSRNLELITKPQWECEGRPDKTETCSIHPVKPCQGFKMGTRSGLAHGPTQAVCTDCSDHFHAARPLDHKSWEYWDHPSNVQLLTVPFKRRKQVDLHLVPRCNCTETRAALNLCSSCRDEEHQRYRRDYQAAAFAVSCQQCRIDFASQVREDWFWRDMVAHVTEEAKQALECLICKGTVDGYVVVGRRGIGAFDEFGVGRRIDDTLPWVGYRPT